MSENDFDERLQKLENQIRQINDRNVKVELDKAWETSNFRILCVCALTWIIMSLVFWIIGVKDCFTNAIIPTLGFYLSNRSLPILKKRWVEYHSNKIFREWSR